MTINEAIERLKILAEEQDEDWLDFGYSALQLGIEALKAIKADRCGDASLLNRPLPGETEE